MSENTKVVTVIALAIVVITSVNIVANHFKKINDENHKHELILKNCSK